jgi:hypothetical protein
MREIGGNSPEIAVDTVSPTSVTHGRVEKVYAGHQGVPPPCSLVKAIMILFRWQLRPTVG